MKIQYLTKFFGSKETTEMKEDRNLFELFKSLDPVSFFIPFGTCCLPAKTIETLGLRRFSLPMDWLFTTNPMLVHCINDDFSTFLDKKYYSFIPLHERPWGEDHSFCHHSFYRENHNANFVFNHFNPLEGPVYETLKRRTDRLINTLSSKENKVFLNFSHDSCKKEDFIHLHNAIKEKYSNFSLVMISYNGISTDGEFIKNVSFLDQSCYCEFYSFSKFTGDRFHADIDNSIIHSILSFMKKDAAFDFLKE
ncbi:DUF1796 family putative cysteine peptidase [Gluconacetobacter sp. Hr-1-5]|uniref:DUF1796 family putative cysteine peptidase n=1 Tax=Gluconacetobacter sp. Hr-1-5 TaxID=3395370 RepID=UPI003B519D84